MDITLISQNLIGALVFFAIACTSLPYIALGALRFQVSRKKSESKDIEKFLKSLTGLSHFLFLGAKGHIVFTSSLNTGRTLHQDLVSLVGLSGILLWYNLAIPFIAGVVFAAVPVFIWLGGIFLGGLESKIMGSIFFALYIILVIKSLTFGNEL